MSSTETPVPINQRNARAYDPKLPVVTVITVVFNRKDALQKTIESVVCQTYPNLEYIVIDGGSTDGTLDVIKHFGDKINLWISEPDKGIYDAMNKGIRLASGDWINFMNSGDIFSTDQTLELFANTNTADTDIIYGNALIDYGAFKTRYKVHPLQHMWRQTPFCHQATFARAGLLKEYQFDRSYKFGSDYDFFFRAYKANKKFKYVDNLICIFEGDQGASKKHFIAAMHELFHSSLKHDFKISHWIYYKLYMAYLHTNLFAKNIIGQELVFKAKNMFQRQK